MPISEIELFQTLKGKLGEKETQTLVEYVRGGLHESATDLVTQNDLLLTEARMKELILRTEKNTAEQFKQVAEQIGTVEKKSTEQITRLEKDMLRLESKLEAGFKDQLKWLIVLLLGFASLITAVVKLI